MDKINTYWFTPSVLPWGSQFIPCLRLMGLKNEQPKLINLCIHKHCIFEVGHKAEYFSKMNCNLIELKSKHCEGAEAQRSERLVLAELAEFHPREFYLDHNVAPSFAENNLEKFIYFISEVA